MPVLTTFQGRAEAAPVIAPEEVAPFIHAYETQRRGAILLAVAIPGQGSIPVRMARWNELDISGVSATAETDEAPDVSVGMAESTITPARVRFRMVISDEQMVEAREGVPAQALAAGLEALAIRMNADLPAVSSGATIVFGNTATPFDWAQFQAFCGFYRALELPHGPLGRGLMLADAPLGVLEASVDASQATAIKRPGDTLGDDLVDDESFVGTLRGVKIFRDAAVAADAPGWSNFATPIGMDFSGLGIAVSQLPTMRPTRGDTAENRGSSFYHFSAWYGVGIVNPRRFIEVLSQ
ncbi:MAG: hypothetical protein AAGF11_54480 [Myxococcota bacterium]